MVAPGPGNTRLKSARQGLGLRSQQALADAVAHTARSIGLRISVTARTVRRWESDNPPWPQPDHQAALEALFQRSITDLGFVPPWVDGPATQPSGEQVGRRAFVSVAAGIGAGALTAFPSRSAGATLPASVASDYIDITAAHRRMYYSVPATRLHKPVAAHANLGTSLLPAVPEAARTSLAAAIAESSMLAGRLEFFDLQQPEAAQDSFIVALQAAQDAHDPLLGAAVLAHMAFIPAFSGIPKRAEEARDKVRAARAFARRGPASPELLAWLDAVEAEIETRFGNTRNALRLINHAEEVLATGERRPSPAWLDWFSPDRLAGFKGNTLMADRQFGPARETLQRVLDNSADNEDKQRSVTLADLAAVAVSENDPEQACALAEAALDNLARYWYATGMERVRTVRQSLAPWDSLPCVRQLDERLYDWNTMVSALTG
jgi:tetratricopeptide (TPR) repeat protein